MGRLHLSTRQIAFLVVGIFVILLSGCGGGGGSTPILGGSGSGSGSGDTGTVAVLISDAPEDIERLFIYVTEVALIPANGSRPVVVYENPAGCKIDLLAYQDDEAFILKLAEVPTGYYEKVRLKVGRVEVEGENSPCSEDIEIKLPSGKIDLVDRGGGGFRVRPGKLLAITLEVDGPKSIDLHLAGNSGKCIFRPVVFVDFEELRAPGRCPYFVSGNITRIRSEADDIIGFALTNTRGEFRIVLSEATAFFDEFGVSTDASIIQLDQTAGVFGRLLPNGRIKALAVAVGDVRLVRGVVQSAVVDDQFALKPPIGEDLLIGVADTEVYIGCNDDDKSGPETIQPGFLAKVMGVVPPDNVTVENAEDFTAVVVFLKKEIQGLLTDVELNGDTTLQIEYAPGQSVEITLPPDAAIYLEGDGPIPLDDLQVRVACQDLQKPGVRVILPLNMNDPTATPEVLVRPDRIAGTIVDIDRFSRSLWVRDSNGMVLKVNVRLGAFILLDVGGYDMPISFYDLQRYDAMTAFGLRSCPGSADFDFEAYIVLAE